MEKQGVNAKLANNILFHRRIGKIYIQKHTSKYDTFYMSVVVLIIENLFSCQLS